MEHLELLSVKYAERNGTDKLQGSRNMQGGLEHIELLGSRNMQGGMEQIELLGSRNMQGG